ncbi:MAG: ATP phosphoribosyltransferase regulatory subunit, partial [Hymenobacteraceae bacterium]|nr:ATP phosphoribosyltransferase regulatory subunit [Hymenobacteraceae bacterium]
MSQKPSLPRGTRDFGPAEVAKRQYVMGIIRRTFERYGFAPLETPTFENLSTLTGKYGEEGDQLLYRVLNSGDFLSDVTAEDFGAGYKKVTPKVTEKGLRYDLTVPFARYVVMNRHALTLPFRRYQMQPVWRADRPSKGRYREFVQCDADVVGTDSLLCEAEIVLMIHDVMTELKQPYVLKINHRGLLRALYDVVADPAPETDLYTALDKLDKIGWDGVGKELTNRGFGPEAAGKLQALLTDAAAPLSPARLDTLAGTFTASPAAPKALADLQAVSAFLTDSRFDGWTNLELDLTLARGLSYYTGCIFGVKVPAASVGSVGGGGRYDNL